MELQPLPLSAMEMIANEPIRVVHGRKAVCDGGMHWRLFCPLLLTLLPQAQVLSVIRKYLSI